MSQRSLDVRLALPTLGLWGGAWLAPLVAPTLVMVLVAVLVVSVALTALLRPLPRVALVVVALAAVGAMSMALRVAHLDAGPLAAWADEHRRVEVTGVVRTDPELTHRQSFGGAGSLQVRVEVRAERVESGTDSADTRAPVLVVGDAGGWQDVRFGDTVSFQGSLRTAPDTRPLATYVFASGPPTLVGSPAAPLRWAEGMRGGLRDAVAGTGVDAEGLLPALVVGDTSAMPPLLTADLRDSGLAHLTAVSGANVAIIVGAALLLSRWAGVRGHLLVGAGLAVVVWFVLLARPQPSVLRAAVMGAIALVAVGAAGRTQAVRSLLACIVVLLLADPWLSRSWGFALSVAATAGLVLLARRWSGRLPERWPRAARDAAAVALAAQVATLPLVVALSGQVAVLSVVANLLVAPAVPPATVLGAAAAATSPVLPTLAQGLAWLGQWPAAWIAVVARQTASASLATMPWPEGWLGGLLGLGGLVLGVVIWWLGATRGWWRPRRLAMLTIASVAVLAGFVAGPGRWPPPGWVMVACDIGQGDALVVNLGDGAGLVVDAGPDPALVDRCLDRLDIEQVPLLVLTHFHADHVAGVAGVLDGRVVGSVLVSPLRDPLEQVARVADATRGMTVIDATPGQTGRWGPASWRVLWPEDTVPGDGSAANNASVVLLVEVSGVRVLLTGDIEPSAQRALVESGADLSADVLKAPHHGSRYQDPAFWQAVHPRAAVVCVGADNTYGHPDPDLMAALGASGVLVRRTDVDGSVAVVQSDGELRMVAAP